MGRTYCVYVHTHKEDGRKYFGVTCQTLNMRWKQGRGYKGSTNMYDAFQRYGWDGFYHNVVKAGLSKEDAYALEEEMIRAYKTQDIKYGFNLQGGGLHPSQHPESMKLVSEHQRGKFVSEETRKKLSEAQKANPHKNDPRPEWVKKKISKTHTGMKYGEETKQKLREHFSVPVLCVELNKVFPSSTEAAKAFGINKVTISAMLNGRLKTAAGYHWKRIDNSECGTTIPEGSTLKRVEKTGISENEIVI